MNDIVKIVFYDDVANSEELKPGGRLPKDLNFLGHTANVLEPEFGFMGLMRFNDIRNIEARAMRYGRWSIGLRRGGPHGTIVHSRYSLDPPQAPEVTCDFAFSAAVQVLGGKPDPRTIIRGNMLITMVLIAEETDVVAVVRQTRISASFAESWNADITRQLKNISEFDNHAHLTAVAEVYTADPTIGPRNCFCWSVSIQGRAE